MIAQLEIKRSIFYGWWVVIALLMIQMVGSMGRYSMTAFFPFVSSELGWSRSLIGSAQCISLWMYAIFAPISGWLIDYFGSRKTFLLGGLITLFGWIFLSIMRGEWGLYIYYGLFMGVAYSICHMVPLQATANKWFRKRAGLVTGIIAAGLGVGIAVLVPLLTNMAYYWGWRTTAVIYGLSSGITIMLMAYYIIVDTPESIGLHPDNEKLAQISNNNIIGKPISIKDAFKTLPFWYLFITYSLIGIPIQGVLAHLVIWGVDVGTSKVAAGFFITIMALPNIFSKILGGWLGDKAGKKKMIVLGQLFSVLVMLWAWQFVYTSQTLKIFAILIGLAYGFSIGLFAPYLSDLFGRANVGTLFGILTTGHGLLGGFGPLLWGCIFDASGSYNLSCLISAVCFGLAAMAVFPINSKTSTWKVE